MRAILICLAFMAALTIGFAPTVIEKLISFGVFVLAVGVVYLLDKFENK